MGDFKASIKDRIKMENISIVIGILKLRRDGLLDQDLDMHSSFPLKMGFIVLNFIFINLNLRTFVPH